jgi:hypothetical protein
MYYIVTHVASRSRRIAAARSDPALPLRLPTPALMMIATSRLLPILPNLPLDEESDGEVLIYTGFRQTQGGGVLCPLDGLPGHGMGTAADGHATPCE